MSEVNELEISIAEAKKMVDRKDQALKLASNREFRKLILEGYFKEEAARLVEVSALPHFEDKRDEIFGEIKGISYFQQYLRNIVRAGEVAERDIRDQSEELDMLRSEEGMH